MQDWPLTSCNLCKSDSSWGTPGPKLKDQLYQMLSPFTALGILLKLEHHFPCTELAWPFPPSPSSQQAGIVWFWLQRKLSTNKSSVFSPQLETVLHMWIKHQARAVLRPLGPSGFLSCCAFYFFSFSNVQRSEAWEIAPEPNSFAEELHGGYKTGLSPLTTVKIGIWQKSKTVHVHTRVANKTLYFIRSWPSFCSIKKILLKVFS